MQPDLEQQDQHTQLRQRRDRLVGWVQQAESRLPQDHARDQLAEHRRLPDSLSDVAQQLGGDNRRRQRQEQRCEVAVYHGPHQQWRDRQS